ncbi:MAG: hypothetical protein IJV92_04795 [Phascolarctobacterium sp.]|nr:hypothetical protein [Phascolarctobacterium sp.]
MRLKDNNKFVATKIRDFAKLIMKERAVTERVERHFKNLVRTTGKPYRSVQLLTLWTIIKAYPKASLPHLTYLDIEGFIDAATAENNWAKVKNLPKTSDIMGAIERKVDVGEYR